MILDLRYLPEEAPNIPPSATLVFGSLALVHRATMYPRVPRGRLPEGSRRTSQRPTLPMELRFRR